MQNISKDDIGIKGDSISKKNKNEPKVKARTNKDIEKELKDFYTDDISVRVSFSLYGDKYDLVPIFA